MAKKSRPSVPRKRSARSDERPSGAKSDPTDVPPRSQSPPIVGIGASAGGLDALTRLIGHLPADTGLAYVVVQHLDPTHESILAEILGHSATVPVVQAHDGVKVEPDHAYVIPPNTTMTVTDGHLRLVGRAAHGPHLPVDAFLCSLAEVHRSSAVGVILSGAGSDGARGIEAIKAEGGITIAQDPESAPYPSMPQSAVATGYVDFVLRPEEIADRLAKLGRHVAAHAPVGDSEGHPTAIETQELSKILVALRNRTGVDFREYRHGTVQRRILRRMLLHRQDTHAEYLAHLRSDPHELDALYADLLIGVTSFFRDPETFHALQRDGFPAMMAGHAHGAPVRAWVPGCSSGEETYSVAIALLEFLGDAARDTPIQVFGTDLSESSIARARAAHYPEGIAAVVSPERLQRFFVKEDGGYRISKAVRDLCVFSRQNLLRDPPFSHLDLITCRNVLIYLEPAVQQRIFPIFHYALEANGLLLLGSAESVGAASPLFTPLDKRHKIFRPRPGLPRALTVGIAVTTAARGALKRGPITLDLRPSIDEVQAEADRLVLARYAPGGVVIDDHLEILQFRGRTSAFLEHAPGTASLNLLKLVRPELVAPLRSAIQTARARSQRASEEGISIHDLNVVRRASLEVIPFRTAPSGARYFIVTFHDEPGPVRSPDAPAPKEGPRDAASKKERGRLSELREELAALKRYSQTIIEEHEAANEELRAASEEVQSSNEELQSTNEELETTKEEIQSINEELSTVNEELRHRNRELNVLSSDLANVLASTFIPIVIVGSDLRLRRFTPAAERVMKVIPTDLGRPLEDVKLRVRLPDLAERIATTIETLATTEQDVQDDEGHWWTMTIRPYRTADRKVDGAVLVFADVDASKQYGQRMAEASEVRRQLLAASETARADADRARAAAEVANETKSSFLANMSHDLRTPLNAIAGYTELLELGIRGPVTEMQRSDFGRIKRNARHLLALINDILNFVKVDQGHMELHVTDVALRDILTELVDMMKPQFRAKSIALELGECTSIARADPERLQQILLNLLGNALKFTNAGGRVAVACTESAGSAMIVVSDTGIGIAPDDLDRMFEPFIQLNRTLSSGEANGVGLGLATSRDMARRMGGDITVESVLGEGSHFSLRLPLPAVVAPEGGAMPLSPFLNELSPQA